LSSKQKKKYGPGEEGKKAGLRRRVNVQMPRTPPFTKGKLTKNPKKNQSSPRRVIEGKGFQRGSISPKSTERRFSRVTNRHIEKTRALRLGSTKKKTRKSRVRGATHQPFPGTFPKQTRSEKKQEKGVREKNLYKTHTKEDLTHKKNLGFQKDLFAQKTGTGDPSRALA